MTPKTVFNKQIVLPKIVLYGIMYTFASEKVTNR